MKYNYIIALLCAATLLAGCKKDELSDTSVFSDNTFGSSITDEAEFDNWLMKNYTNPYNIRFQYRYVDKESNMSYNVIPAEIGRAKALAKLVKHVWMDAYVEGVNKEFLCNYSFRVIQLIGSLQYSSNGEVVMGTAEGGIKVLLYGVNRLDTLNIRVNTSDPYMNKAELPLDLNYWFFHTMHHEFCHILTQKKEYTTEFRAISSGRYHASDWINVKDEDAPKEGFVTGYASGEYNEDFAELYANYVTLTAAGWQKILDKAVVYTYSYTNQGVPQTKETTPKMSDTEVENMRKNYPDFTLTKTDTYGLDIINQKIEIVKDYFLTKWNIDLDNIRAIVTRRSEEASKLNLNVLD